MLTLAIIAIILAVIAIGASVYLYITLQKTKAQAEKDMEAAKQKWLKDQQTKLITLRQQMIGSVNRELQGPVTSIITPLQTTRLETLPEAARAKMVKAMMNAQNLLRQLNMLLDFHYTARTGGKARATANSGSNSNS